MNHRWVRCPRLAITLSQTTAPSIRSHLTDMYRKKSDKDTKTDIACYEEFQRNKQNDKQITATSVLEYQESFPVLEAHPSLPFPEASFPVEAFPSAFPSAFPLAFPSAYPLASLQAFRQAFRQARPSAFQQARPSAWRAEHWSLARWRSLRSTQTDSTYPGQT